MSAFPDAPSGVPARAHFGVLFRLEMNGAPTLLVQSVVAPDWGRLPDGALHDAETRPLALDGLAVGDRLRFRLIANPIRAVSRPLPGGGFRKHSGREPITTEEGRTAWIERVMAPAGVVSGVAISNPIGARMVTHGRDDSRRRFDAVAFEGVIEVSDPDNLRRLLRDGIGKGRAFGLGLLSVARMR